MWLLVKRGIEGEDGPRSFQTIAGEIEFIHCMKVLNVKLDRRTIGRLAHPRVEVFAFASFEEEDIVAIVQFGYFIELKELAFSVKLRLFATVREEGIEVIQKMSMSWTLC